MINIDIYNNDNYGISSDSYNSSLISKYVNYNY